MWLKLKYYAAFFLRPYLPWQPRGSLHGLGALLAILLVGSATALAYGLHGFHHSQISGQLKKVYPKVFWYCKGCPDRLALEGDLEVRPELFSPAEKLLFRPGALPERPMETRCGVRALGPETLWRDWGIGLAGEDKAGCFPVLVSRALSQALAPVPGLARGSRLEIRTHNGGWLPVVLAAPPFAMDTGEKWMLLPLDAWSEIRGAREGAPNIMAVYSTGGREVSAGEVQHGTANGPESGKKVFTWDQRTSFFYRMAYLVAWEGVVVFMALMCLLAAVYLVGLFNMFFLEHRVGIHLFRLFGAKRLEMGGVLFGLFSGVLLFSLIASVGVAAMAAGALLFRFQPQSLSPETLEAMASWALNQHGEWYVFMALGLALGAAALMVVAIFRRAPEKLLDR